MVENNEQMALIQLSLQENIKISCCDLTYTQYLRASLDGIYKKGMTRLVEIK